MINATKVSLFFSQNWKLLSKTVSVSVPHIFFVLTNTFAALFKNVDAHKKFFELGCCSPAVDCVEVKTLFCHFFFKEYASGESFFKLWSWLWWNKNPLTSLIFLTTFGETDFTAFISQVWLGKSILNMILLIIFQCMIICFCSALQIKNNSKSTLLANDEQWSRNIEIVAFFQARCFPA